MAEVRVPCPACGGLVHPISGRCKHCKADLHALRGARPSAAAELPALSGAATPAVRGAGRLGGVSRSGGAAPVLRGPAQAAAAEILPPRATGWMAAAPTRRGPSPLVVVALLGAVAALGVVIFVMMTRSPSKPSPVAAAPKPGTTPPGSSAPGTAPPGTAPPGTAPPGSSAPGTAQPGATTPDAAAPAPPDAAVASLVRPPVEADLAEYTRDLPPGDTLLATIDTSLGKIRCQLFDKRTPIAVANFIGLAMGKKPWTDPKTSTTRTGAPFYDRLVFHRVIEDFMIQGGDPLGLGTGGPGYQFEDELDPQLTMQTGSLAMANAGPNTNGSQFFITDSAPDWLNGKHTIFGKCGSRSIVRRIARVPTDPTNHPTSDVVIRTITITRQ